MRNWLLLALVLAPPAHAQFDLLLVEGTTERAAPAFYDFGSWYAGESASAHFRLRNTSSSAVTLNLLTVAGVGFTLASPALPLGVPPQGAIDLTVVFRATDTGAYSAALRSEGVAILLTATVAPRLTYRAVPASGTPFPGTLDFGNVVRGSGSQRRITIQNETPLVLIIPAISVQGVDFGMLGVPPSGQALATHQSGEFTIVLTPHSTGGLQGLLTLGDRSYQLLGAGIDPPLPKPSVSLDLQQAASAQQGNLVVSLRRSGAGQRYGDCNHGLPRSPRRRHRLRRGRAPRHVFHRAWRSTGHAAVPDRYHCGRAHLYSANRRRR